MQLEAIASICVAMQDFQTHTQIQLIIIALIKMMNSVYFTQNLRNRSDSGRNFRGVKIKFILQIVPVRLTQLQFDYNLSESLPATTFNKTFKKEGN